jgi:hypothetical protein
MSYRSTKQLARAIQDVSGMAPSLHILYLPGAPNRLSTPQKWRWWRITHEATTRLVADQPDGVTLAEPRP